MAPNYRVDRPIRRYEVVWEREPSLAAAVEVAWSRRLACNDLGDVSNSLQMVMSSLYNWKNTHFKSIRKEIDKKRALLDALNQQTDDASMEKRIGLQKEMDELLYREEIFWMQRSRIS
jgi:predicted transcriptional regulator